MKWLSWGNIKVLMGLPSSRSSSGSLCLVFPSSQRPPVFPSSQPLLVVPPVSACYHSLSRLWILILPLPIVIILGPPG